jgi:hypothetical protein
MEQLKNCENPIEMLKFGRIRIGYRWGDGCWENDINGFREKYYFKFYKVYDDSRSAFGLVIGSLSLHFSTLDKATKK